jgi:hypothetical protein
VPSPWRSTSREVPLAAKAVAERRRGTPAGGAGAGGRKAPPWPGARPGAGSARERRSRRRSRDDIMCSKCAGAGAGLFIVV